MMHRVVVLLIAIVAICSVAEKVKHPIVLIPGFMSTELHVNLTNVKTDSLFCMKNKKNFHIYLNMGYQFGFFDCVRQYTGSEFVDGKWERKAGVAKYVKSYPSVVDVAKIGSENVFQTMVDYLAKEGYEDKKNLFASGYDWTELPTEEWMERTKELIEKAYSSNGNSKVVLVVHSMGSPFSYYFLKTMNDRDPTWVEKYIFKYIPIAPAWAGATFALKDMLYTEFIREIVWPTVTNKVSSFFDTAVNAIARFFHRKNTAQGQTERSPVWNVLHNKKLTTWVRHLPSAWVIIPWEEAYGDSLLAETPRRTYKATELASFLKIFSTSDKKVDGMLTTQTNFKNSIDTYSWVPPVPVRIMYGLGVKTPLSLKVKQMPEKHDFDDVVQWKEVDMVFSEEGDGTVPAKSLSFVGDMWEDGSNDVQTTIFQEGEREHRGILKNTILIQKIVEEATDEK